MLKRNFRNILILLALRQVMGMALSPAFSKSSWDNQRSLDF
jgi:hypothetical protein